MKPQDCTCGKCYTGKDENGNQDYGARWSYSRNTYVVRNCPVARAAWQRGVSVEQLRREGSLYVS